jgi:opacity protein-like surface antigen
MKRIQFLLIAVVTVISTAPAFSADATGTWTASFDTQVGVQKYTYTFQVEGSKLTGRAKSDNGDTEITDGKVSGDTLTFVENLNFQGMPLRIEYTGKLTGDEIKFVRKVADVATEELVAKRVK